MELDEFDVGDRGSGAISARDAVSGGDIGIGRVFEDASQAAGGQQHAARFDQSRPNGVVSSKRATPSYFAICQQQIGDGREALERDVLKRTARC